MSEKQWRKTIQIEFVSATFTVVKVRVMLTREGCLLWDGFPRPGMVFLGKYMEDSDNLCSFLNRSYTWNVIIMASKLRTIVYGNSNQKL